MPKKIGAGGQQQEYDESTGQYGGGTSYRQNTSYGEIAKADYEKMYGYMTAANRHFKEHGNLDSFEGHNGISGDAARQNLKENEAVYKTSKGVMPYVQAEMHDYIKAMEESAENDTYKINGKDVEVLDKIPQGWQEIKGALTAPRGTMWVSNGQSLFAKDENGNRKYKKALVVVDKELWEESKKRK